MERGQIYLLAHSQLLADSASHQHPPSARTGHSPRSHNGLELDLAVQQVAATKGTAHLSANTLNNTALKLIHPRYKLQHVLLENVELDWDLRQFICLRVLIH